MYDVVALAQWHRHFAWQANLNQALHETEQRAKRVSAVEQYDPFAAAVLAREWLGSTQGLNAGMFPDLYAKRALTEAVEYLQRAAHPVGLESEIGAYFTRMDHLARFRKVAGEDPQRYVNDARTRFDRQGNGNLWLIGAVPLGLLVLLSLIGKNVGGAMFLGFLAAPFIIMFTNARAAKAKLARELHERERVGGDFQAFIASPDGYPWLQRMWQAHRLLFEMAPAGPQSARGAAPVAVERHVVERQIVVVRCRFCRQLTPVDRPSCEHCGAAGFGSSHG